MWEVVMSFKSRALLLCSLLFPCLAPVSARAQSITITSPANSAAVSGTVTIMTNEGSNVSWISVFADGVWFASNDPTALRPYSVQWDSTAVPNGAHTISVTGYSSSNKVRGSYSILLVVANGIAATAIPTPVAT